MKKLWLFMLFAIVSCGSGEKKESNKVIVYAPHPLTFINPIVDAFTRDTGIEVEVIVAGTGELIKRVEAEANKPLGDVLWGGSSATVTPRNEGLFATHISPHEDKVYEIYRNVEGNQTRFTTIPSVIMVNTDFVDIPINGYEDLLNPVLKGKIAFADPNLSSSSFEHLVNMLYAMGNGDPEKGWWYVEKLIDNLDKKILSGSSAVYKGVADGEYAVGLTFEEGALNYVAPGKPIEVVYMKEGVIFKAFGAYVINNGPNMENGKVFVDYLAGETVQGMVEDLNRRTIRADIPSKGKIKSLSEINLIEDDEAVVATKKQEWLNKFKDVLIKSK